MTATAFITARVDAETKQRFQELAAGQGLTESVLLKRLVDHGLLTEITGRVRNRRFCYAPYIRIFTDNI